MRIEKIHGYALPSSSFAMTTPVPALALNRNPALKMVKIAKPLAC